MPKSKITNNDENKSVKGRQAGLRNVDVKDFKVAPDKPKHISVYNKILTYIGIGAETFKVFLNLSTFYLLGIKANSLILLVNQL